MRMPGGKIPREWMLEQETLARRVVMAPFAGLPRYIAGADIAFFCEMAQAAALVWDRESGRVVDQVVIRRPVEYPYVPGFLSFREGPILLEAIGQLKHAWEVILFDGQGVCHPRRCGLACHVGVQLGRPAVGAAKSRLCGEHAEPALPAGSAEPVSLDGEVLAVALRTREGVRPMYISVGHRMDLPSAARIVMACCRYRMPEPTRLADKLSRAPMRV
jgi:deoxyribonuclease V